MSDTTWRALMLGLVFGASVSVSAELRGLRHDVVFQTCVIEAMRGVTCKEASK